MESHQLTKSNSIDQNEFAMIIKAIKSIELSQDTDSNDLVESNDSIELSKKNMLLKDFENIMIKGTEEEKLVFLYTYLSIDSEFDLIDSWVIIFKKINNRIKKIDSSVSKVATIKIKDRNQRFPTKKSKRIKRYIKKKNNILAFLYLIYDQSCIQLASKSSRLLELVKLLKNEPYTKKIIDKLEEFRIMRIINKTIKKRATFQIKSEYKIENLFDIEPKFLAMELTREAGSIFCQITPHELVSTLYDKNYDKNQNIGYFINQFNKISYWVPTEIVRKKKISDQIETLHYFIELGTELKELGNFHHLMAIIAGLNNTAIKRLDYLWNQEAYGFKLATLELFMYSYDNFRNYRDYLEKIIGNNPIVPYIGIMFTDLRHIYDMMDNFLDNDDNDNAFITKHVNFSKLMCLYYIIEKFIKMQVPNNFDQDIVIKHFLVNIEVWYDKDKLYDESCKIMAKRGTTKRQINRGVSFSPFSKKKHSRKFSLNAY